MRDLEGNNTNGRKIRVHIENLSTHKNPHAQIHLKDIDQCAGKYPGVRDRLEVSIGWDYKNFEKNMEDAEVLIFMGVDFNPGNFASYAKKLRWIQLTAAGVDHIMPFDWLPSNVVLTTNSGVHAEKHGEFGLTAILMLNNNLPAMMTNQRHARWQKIFSSSIKGKTLAVIGVGSTGTAIAQRAKALGMRVLGVRRSGRKQRYVDKMYAPSELHLVIPEADFLVATLPLTNETTNLLDRKALALLKPGAGVVNLGRAGTMDYEALVEMVENGRLRGAVLDTYDPEPLPESSALWRAANIIVSPHCTSADVNQYVPLTLDLAYENFGRYMERRPLINRVNRELGY
jgi:phosphoglycerate dehydrogenase-like enzyme